MHRFVTTITMMLIYTKLPLLKLPSLRDGMEQQSGALRLKVELNTSGFALLAFLR